MTAAGPGVLPNKKIWGEDFCLAASFILFGVGAAVSIVKQGFDNVPWRSYPYAIPTGLLFLLYVNRRLRSKVLGWSVFTLSFAALLAVLGAFVVTLRVVKEIEWWPYLGGLSLYFFILMTGLFQLRPRWSRIPSQGGNVS